MCIIFHLENIKARAELSPASASRRSCSILPAYTNPYQHWYPIWKPFLLQLISQAHLQCTIWFPPHNNFQHSLPIFQEMFNPIIKLTNSLFPAACPAPVSHPCPSPCSSSHLLLCGLPFQVRRRIIALRPSGDVFENVCNVVVILNAEKSDNGSMSSSDTARIQKLSEMLIKSGSHLVQSLVYSRTAAYTRSRQLLLLICFSIFL